MCMMNCYQCHIYFFHRAWSQFFKSCLLIIYTIMTSHLTSYTLFIINFKYNPMYFMPLGANVRTYTYIHIYGQSTVHIKYFCGIAFVKGKKILNMFPTVEIQPLIFVTNRWCLWSKIILCTAANIRNYSCEMYI